MNIRIAIVTSFAILVAVNAQAQDAEDSACAALLCMSGPEGQLPHECKSSTDAFFDIRVYRRGTFSTAFDPVRTSNKRRDTLFASCEGARAIDIDRTIAKFGSLQYSPFGFD